MIKFIILLPAIFACTVSARGQLKFGTALIEDRIDSSKREYSFSYKLKNDGSDAVKITDITASCGCTSAESDKNMYAPGETGEIKGTFAIGDRRGLQEQYIIVKTDAPGQPQTILELRLTIIDPIKISPKVVFWKIGEKNTSKEIKLDIPNADEAGIQKINCDNGIFEIKLLKEDALSDKYVLEVLPAKTSEAAKGIITITLKEKSGLNRNFYAHAVIK